MPTSSAVRTAIGRLAKALLDELHIEGGCLRVVALARSGQVMAHRD